MYAEGDFIKTTIYVDVRPTSAFTQGYAFFRNGSISDIPFNDFYLNVPLYKTYQVMDYVDVQKDNRIQKIDRQEINPFYLEYAFFDNILRNKVNNGSNLTDTMVNYILSVRTDLQGLTNVEIRNWFDYVGKNELPWTSPDGTKVTIDEIETSQVMLTSIVSKAKLLNIDIQK